MTFPILILYLALKKQYPDWSVGVELLDTVTLGDAKCVIWDGGFKMFTVYINPDTTSDHARDIISMFRLTHQQNTRR